MMRRLAAVVSDKFGSAERWQDVTKTGIRCPVCGKDHWCSVLEDENGTMFITCRRDFESDAYRRIKRALDVDGQEYAVYEIGEPDEGEPHARPDYEYRDEKGQLLFGVWRNPEGPARFTQRQWKDGQWQGRLGDARRVLYRLPEIIQAVREGHTIYIAEGEKDVETLVKRGLQATTNPMGAGRWREEYGTYLLGADVVVLGDMDEAGAKHVEQVAESLERVAQSIQVVRSYPGFTPGSKADVTDWMEAGGTVQKLEELAEPWEPLHRFTFRSVTELVEGDYQMEWIIGDGVLAQGYLTLLLGPPGAGKSLLSLDMAFAIAQGKRWLHFPVERNSPVLFMTGEGGPQSLQARVLARCKDRQPAPPVSFWWPQADERFTLDDPACIRRLIREIDHSGAGVVVLDPLAEFNTKDENSTQDMLVAVRQLREVIYTTGAAIILVHHTRKPGSNSSRGSGMEGRGSVALFGACDSTLVLDRPKRSGSSTSPRPATPRVPHRWRWSSAKTSSSGRSGPSPRGKAQPSLPVLPYAERRATTGSRRTA